MHLIFNLEGISAGKYYSFLLVNPPLQKGISFFRCRVSGRLLHGVYLDECRDSQ